MAESDIDININTEPLSNFADLVDRYKSSLSDAASTMADMEKSWANMAKMMGAQVTVPA